MAVLAVQALAGALAFVYLMGAINAQGSLNNCAFISGCIQYSETECDSEGKRQACITWGNPNGAGGCVLTRGSDVIDTACRENTQGTVTNTPCPTAIFTTPEFTVANSQPLAAQPATVPLGTTVTITCASGFRLSTSTATSQFVTCQSDGSFTALQTTTCIPTVPRSCREYFTYQDPFAAAASVCDDVTINPTRTATSAGTDIAVRCCKTGTQFRTELPPAAGATGTVDGTQCNVATSTASGSGSTTLNTANNAFCGTGATHTAVSYTPTPANDEARIREIVGTHCAGACAQTTSITCTPGTLAVSLKLNTEANYFFYGTNTFTPQEALGLDFGAGAALGNYFNSGAACDCTTAGADATSTCRDGCSCTVSGHTGGTSDTITRVLTLGNLLYVQGHRISNHAALSSPAANSFTVTVGGIQCVETF